MNLKFYYTQMINAIRANRKLALYAESRFLYDLNRKIHTTNYQNLVPPPLENEKPIIISLTTHRDRIHYLHYVLDSLFFQILRPIQVRLYLAKDEYKTLPPILHAFKPWLQIIEWEDIGSFKKSIPILTQAYEENLDVHIISVDDDLIYPPNFTLKLIDLKKKHPNARIGYLGSKCKKKICEDGSAYELGGFGILWNTEVFNPAANPLFFDSDIFIRQMGIRNNDDAWHNEWCRALGVQQVSLETDFFTVFRRDFVALPSEHMHALTAEASDLNIAKISKRKDIVANLKNIVRKAIAQQESRKKTSDKV